MDGIFLFRIQQFSVFKLLVHSGGFFLFCCLAHRQHLDPEPSLSKSDLDHVADLHLIACFDLPPVYADALAVAGVIGNASALYEP